MLIMYEVFQIPLLLSFPEIDTTTMDTFSNIINFFFMFDMLLSFNTGYYKRGTLVMKRKEIIKHYLRTWFFIGLFINKFP